MNGAVYISFFQGQLESVLEQVVQLAVRELSGTVGGSLNALLLETAAKEQENRRLRGQLQRDREATATAATRGRGASCSDGGGGEGGAGGGSAAAAAAGKSKAAKAAAKAADESGRTKPEPPQQLHTDTRRLEQRGRIVGKLHNTTHTHTRRETNSGVYV